MRLDGTAKAVPFPSLSFPSLPQVEFSAVSEVLSFQVKGEL
jgi:hypothetical protein